MSSEQNEGVVTTIPVSAYDLAQRFIGVHEAPGLVSNPLVLAFLRLDDSAIQDDSTPWCSAFVNWIAWLLRRPRSKSLAARSWLTVGVPIGLDEAEVGFDVVVLKRGGSKQPGADVIDAPGHVGWFAGVDGTMVSVLGGNQGDAVSVARFPRDQVLGVRRLLTT
jgi:uncharacterized protein (TIGR02594 family)